MIAGIFHEGSGLGDQLFRYITVRTLAEEKGFEWGMICNDLGKNAFKGADFMSVKFHNSSLVKEGQYIEALKALPIWNEKVVRDENGVDIRSYDPEINFVEDNTIIDGSFEDSKYWHHNLANISKWFAVEPLNVPEDTCVVGFRGGEYATQPDLFLTRDYWVDSVATLYAQYPNMRFQVHTDDPPLAYKIFPAHFEIIDNKPISHSKHTNMALNWRTARYAKYAIIPNSAFFILPRLLKHLEDPTAVTIAPRYWARRNTKTWARPACYYKEFTYI